MIAVYGIHNNVSIKIRGSGYVFPGFSPGIESINLTLSRSYIFWGERHAGAAWRFPRAETFSGRVEGAKLPRVARSLLACVGYCVYVCTLCCGCDGVLVVVVVGRSANWLGFRCSLHRAFRPQMTIFKLVPTHPSVLSNFHQSCTLLQKIPSDRLFSRKKNHGSV